MPKLAFDLMALADIGGQPRRLASDIQRQIRDQLGQLLLPMPLVDIASALGIDEIVERPTHAFEGMLVTSPDKSQGKVILREGLLGGRRNFTLGHEIGHFVNPYHRAPPQGFVCDAGGMRAQRRGKTVWAERTAYERMEVEANEFSAALLVPWLEFRRERARLSGCDLRHVEPLAKKFGTSKEVMARIYVDTSDEKIGVLTWRNGKLQSFILPSSFPYLGLSKGGTLPPECRSVSFFTEGSSGMASPVSSVPADVWIERSSLKIELYEQALLQREGWGMTMLLVEEPGDEEREEDEEIERRWSEPRFAYGR